MCLPFFVWETSYRASLNELKMKFGLRESSEAAM